MLPTLLKQEHLSRCPPPRLNFFSFAYCLLYSPKMHARTGKGAKLLGQDMHIKVLSGKKVPGEPGTTLQVIADLYELSRSHIKFVENISHTSADLILR